MKTWVKKDNFQGRYNLSEQVSWNKVAKELLLPKAPDPDGFKGVFYQIFTEWVILTLFGILPNPNRMDHYSTNTPGIERGQISSSFYEENNALIPKSGRHHIERKKLQINFTSKYQCKNS